MKVDRCLGIGVKEKKINDCIISLKAYEPGQLLKQHYHTYPYLSLLINGSYIEKNDLKKEEISFGDFIFRPSFYIHQNTFSKQKSVCFNIEFTNNSLDQYINFNDINLNLKSYSDTKIRAFSLFKSFCNEEEDTQLESILFEIFNEITLQNHVNKLVYSDSDRMKKIIEVLNSNYHRSITIKELSEQIYLHPVYLVRAFKKKFGITIGEYLRRIRIKKAFELLINTRDNFLSIALSCGFYDRIKKLIVYNFFTCIDFIFAIKKR